MKQVERQRRRESRGQAGHPPSRAFMQRAQVTLVMLALGAIGALGTVGVGGCSSTEPSPASRLATSTSRAASTPTSRVVDPPSASRETAVLAGGCFWGMEEILRQVPGVLETEVGYTGGTTDAPTYEDVKTGTTGHAEAVRVVFDPGKLTYRELLESWFFRMHDPTTKDRQGNDVGSSYRSAIFTTSAEQKRIAEEVRAKVDASGKWKSPVVTEIVPAGPFTPAEDYHQDYLQKTPGGYTCHYMREHTY